MVSFETVTVDPISYSPVTPQNTADTAGLFVFRERDADVAPTETAISKSRSVSIIPSMSPPPPVEGADGGVDAAGGGAVTVTDTFTLSSTASTTKSGIGVIENKRATTQRTARGAENRCPFFKKCCMNFLLSGGGRGYRCGIGITATGSGGTDFRTKR